MWRGKGKRRTTPCKRPVPVQGVSAEKALKSGKRGGGGGHTPGDPPKLEKLGALPPPPPFAHGPSYMLVAQQKPGDSPLKKEK